MSNPNKAFGTQKTPAHFAACKARAERAEVERAELAEELSFVTCWEGFALWLRATGQRQFALTGIVLLAPRLGFPDEEQRATICAAAENH